MRALALAEALGRRGCQAVLLVPRRSAGWVRQRGLPALSPPELGEGRSHLSGTDRPSLLGRWVARHLERLRPDLLVVDVFPRGVLGELAGLPLPPRVLVTRRVDPRYYLSVLGFLEGYRLILGSEPPHPALARALGRHPGWRRVPPILMEDRLPAAEACRRLGLEEPGLLVLGGGYPAEEEELYRAVRSLGRPLRFFGLSVRGPEVVRAFPAAAFLGAARRVVAGAGYHSYYEVCRAGVPAVLVPRPRQLDDQFLRARGGLGPAGAPPHRVLERLSDLEGELAALEGAGPEPVDLGWGAQLAAAEILKVLEPAG